MRTFYKILLVIIGIAYLISPFDLIPDFLIPYLGWLDDIVVLWLILYYLKFNRLPSFFYGKNKNNKSSNGFSDQSDTDFSFNNHSAHWQNNYSTNQKAGKHDKQKYKAEDKKNRGNGNYSGNRSSNDDHNYGQRKNSEKKTGKTPHEILGLDKNATKKEIQAAYRKLVKQYHPDRVAHLGKEFQELANKKFIEIQNAYNSLMRL